MDKVKFVLRSPEILGRCLGKIEAMFFAPNTEADLEVVIQEYKTNRSTEQNNRYWMLLRKFSEETGHLVDELHEIFKHGILGSEMIKNPITGEEHVATKGTSKNLLKAGLSFVYKTKAILVAITLDMVAVLFGGAIALLPIYAQDILEVGSEGFGILRAAPAVGSVLMMFVSAYIPLTKNAGKKLLIAIFGFGLSIIAFGVSSIFWVSVISLFLYGVTDGVSMIIRQTILQLKTPDEVRGRVASVNSIFVGSSNELGAFESGLAAKLMGTVQAVVFGGVMTILTVGFTSIKFPNFRKLDLTKDMNE